MLLHPPSNEFTNSHAKGYDGHVIDAILSSSKETFAQIVSIKNARTVSGSRKYIRPLYCIEPRLTLPLQSEARQMLTKSLHPGFG